MKRSIRNVWCCSVFGLVATGFVACAQNEDSAPRAPADTNRVPEVDAGTDDGGDATDGAVDATCGDGSLQDGACSTATDCTSVDFCATAFPVTRQTALNAIWGSGATDIWAVGTRGTILHGDGKSFTAVGSGGTDIYFSVWGWGTNDVWILSPTTPLRSQGFSNGSATFTEQKGATFAANPRIWAGLSTSASGIWLAGDYSWKFGDPAASFWKFEDDGDGGTAWKGAPSCPAGQNCASSIRSLWASGPNDVWAVGSTGQAFRMDDPSTGHWTQLDTRVNHTLFGIWGSGPNDVWAVGDGGTILHTTKTTGPWTSVASPTTNPLRGIWGSGPNDIWAVGDGGTVVHYDGTSWALGTIGLDPGDPVTALLGIWGSGPDDVWIVGEGVILHRTAASRRHS